MRFVFGTITLSSKYNDGILVYLVNMWQLKEYQMKLKALDEEKAKRRSTLESELRVLKAQTDEICDQFDKELHLVGAKPTKFTFWYKQKTDSVVREHTDV